MKNRATIFTLTILAAVGAQAWAQTVTVSDYAFTAGTAISASAMSTKLQALATAINYQANTTDATQNDDIIALKGFVGSPTTSLANLETNKLNSAKWAYASSVLSYTPTDGSISIGTSVYPSLINSTTKYFFMQLTQSSSSTTLCIANTNNGSSNPNSIADPNEALSIIGGKDGGEGGALVQFYRPDGTRLGWMGQNTTYKDQITYSITSDRRLKDGIIDAPYALDRLMRIQVRDFFFKSDPTKQLMNGFIAQELYEVYPEAVSKPAREEGTWGVDYGRLSPLIIKSIQDQQKEIDALKTENTELKAEIAAIKKKLGM